VLINLSRIYDMFSFVTLNSNFTGSK